MNTTNSRSESYVANYGWNSEPPHSSSYLNPKVLSMLATLKPKRILDIGCGNGVLCDQIKQAGYSIVGMDFDQVGIEIARKNFSDINFYSYGVQDDPTILTKEEGLFDMVISTEVVEHLFAPHLLMEYAAAVLDKKGFLLVSTPYHGYWKNLLLAIVGKWDGHHMPLWHGGHIKFWCRASLGQLFVNTSYNIVDFQGVGRIKYFWKSMIIVGQKQ
jgi:2-polyprenyl-3-methyl-5-hydroxy-6-metoxy-1,4-benzoquinol methylase